MCLTVVRLYVYKVCATIPSRLDMTCTCSEMRCISLLEELPVCLRYCSPRSPLSPALFVRVAKKMRSKTMRKSWSCNVVYVNTACRYTCAHVYTQAKEETLILRKHKRQEIHVPLPLHACEDSARRRQLRHQAYVTFEAMALDWTGTRRTWMRPAPPRSRSLLVVEKRLARSL